MNRPVMSDDRLRPPRPPPRLRRGAARSRSVGVAGRGPRLRRGPRCRRLGRARPRARRVRRDPGQEADPAPDVRCRSTTSTSRRSVGDGVRRKGAPDDCRRSDERRAACATTRPRSRRSVTGSPRRWSSATTRRLRRPGGRDGGHLRRDARSWARASPPGRRTPRLQRVSPQPSWSTGSWPGCSAPGWTTSRPPGRRTGASARSPAGRGRCPAPDRGGEGPRPRRRGDGPAEHRQARLPGRPA